MKNKSKRESEEAQSRSSFSSRTNHSGGQWSYQQRVSMGQLRSDAMMQERGMPKGWIVSRDIFGEGEEVGNSVRNKG